MNRFLYTLAVSFVALLFAPSPAHAQQLAYPHGLKDPSNIVSGVYPGSNAGNCCWVSTRAEIKVVVPPAPTRCCSTCICRISLLEAAQCAERANRRSASRAAMLPWGR